MEKNTKKYVSENELATIKAHYAIIDKKAVNTMHSNYERKFNHSFNELVDICSDDINNNNLNSSSIYELLTAIAEKSVYDIAVLTGRKDSYTDYISFVLDLQNRNTSDYVMSNYADLSGELFIVLTELLTDCERPIDLNRVYNLNGKETTIIRELFKVKSRFMRTGRNTTKYEIGEKDCVAFLPNESELFDYFWNSSENDSEYRALDTIARLANLSDLEEYVLLCKYANLNVTIETIASASGKSTGTILSITDRIRKKFDKAFFPTLSAYEKTVNDTVKMLCSDSNIKHKKSMLFKAYRQVAKMEK